MSAAMASSTEPAIIYVRLLNEGVDVWRPVRARRLGEATYEIAADPVPADEEWSFQPGDIVVGEPRRLNDDSEGGPDRGSEAPIIAVALASHFDEPSWTRPRLAG